MDFGLGAFLEKFEQHFGAKWTRRLLIIVAVAIVSGAASGAWTLIIKPVLGVFGLLPDAVTARQIPSLLFLGLQVAASFALASLILDARAKRLTIRHLEFLLTRAEELNETLDDRLEQIAKMLDDIGDTDRAISENAVVSKLLLEDIVNLARQRNIMTPEQVDEVLSLLSAAERPIP